MPDTWQGMLFDGAESDGLRLRLADDADLPCVTEMVVAPSTLIAVGDTAEEAGLLLRQLWHEGTEASGLRHFVAEHQSVTGPIAYLRLEYPLFEPECLWLMFLVVTPGLRAQGWGRRIMELLKARAQASGCVRTFGLHTLAANAAAVGLYQSAGFTCTTREPWATQDGTTTERLTFIWKPEGR